MVSTKPVVRGGIYWIDWNPARGSEQAGRRPGLVVQNHAGNRAPHYPNTIVVAMSTKGRNIPFHVRITASPTNGLAQDGYVKCEQILTIDKGRIEAQIGQLDATELIAVDTALKLSLGVV